MDKIDVILSTLNSNKPWFPLVLRAIKFFVPLNKLIVVDGYSNDGTVELIRGIFGSKALIIRSRANLAYARFLGVKHVETDYFMFVDDDVLLLPCTFSTLKSFVHEASVGAVESPVIATMALNNFVSYYMSLCMNRNNSEQRVSRRMSINEVSKAFIIRRGLFWYIRGLTTSVLIKTEAVQGWKPNPLLGAYEDLHLTQYIISKGYKWIYLVAPLAIHFDFHQIYPLKKALEKGLWHGTSLYILIKDNIITKDNVFLDIISRCGITIIKLLTPNTPKKTRLSYSINLLFQLSQIFGLLTHNRYKINR